MEINVTNLITQTDYSMRDFSGSCAELGQDAGRITWEASKEASDDYNFVNDDNRDGFKDWFGEFGAWERDEINGWSDCELNALFIQFVAGDYRNDFEGDVDEDNRSGRLFRCDIVGHDNYGDWFYYVGN